MRSPPLQSALYSDIRHFVMTAEKLLGLPFGLVCGPEPVRGLGIRPSFSSFVLKRLPHAGGNSEAEIRCIVFHSNLWHLYLLTLNNLHPQTIAVTKVTCLRKPWCKFLQAGQRCKPNLDDFFNCHGEIDLKRGDLRMLPVNSQLKNSSQDRNSTNGPANSP